MSDGYTVADPINGGTLTTRLLRDQIKLRGVPQQGTGFFHAFYTVFRGRGVILTSSRGGQYGLFASINKFFTATSVLYLGCEAGGVGSAAGAHIEAAVLSPTVVSLEAVCSDPERGSLSMWAGSLTRSLARILTSSAKDASRFRIELAISTPPASRRDRDLVVHHVDNLFPPAPTGSSAESLGAFLRDVHAASRCLMLGGFYVLALPMTYSGIDMLLSSIVATASTEAPLTYVGMLLYMNTISRLSADDAQLPLWIFRIEPMNSASLESQRTIALSRLTRYPPVLQDVVKAAMPASSEIGDRSTIFESALAARVTPTATLFSLFRQVSGPFPREVLNMLGTSQPKYSTTIDQVKSISEPKIQVKIIVELLYDISLASQRKCVALAAVGV